METIEVLQNHQGMESYFASSMYNKDILAGMKRHKESFPNMPEMIVAAFATILQDDKVLEGHGDNRGASKPPRYGKLFCFKYVLRRGL